MKIRRDHLLQQPKVIPLADCEVGKVYRLVEYPLPDATMFMKTDTGQFFNIENGSVAGMLPKDRFVEIEGEYVPSGEVL